MAEPDSSAPCCLVTGATGLLGRAVLRRLGAVYRVVPVGCRQLPPDGHQVDLSDPSQLQNLLKTVRPDGVIHLAAHRDPDFCQQHPQESERLNVGSARTLCQSLDPSIPVLFASSDYVFDGTSPPYREDAPVGPVNEYGRQKVRAEEEILARPGGLALRFPVLVGRTSPSGGTGFLAQMVDAVRSGTPQSVDDVLVRFPTWIEDVAEAMAFLLARKVSGVVHFSGLEGATRYQLTREVAELVGGSADHLSPSRVPIPRPAPRPLNAQLEPARLQAMGYSRFTPFREVVRHILKEC